MARTRTRAVPLIAVLVGLSLLDLPPPWHRILRFIVLGLQVELARFKGRAHGSR